jgi:hypothetical protein
MSEFDKIFRKKQDDPQFALFDIEEDWKQYWWGMPEYEMENVAPQYRVNINFMCYEDMKEFSAKTGIPLTTKSNSGWYPHQEPLKGEFIWTGEKTDSRYPVCIMSKGRADCQTTGKWLDKMGVGYRFFVEETEYDLYCQHIGEHRVVKLPFHDLGQGSIPARNFIWEWAKEREFKRHWTVDDNIGHFARCNLNRRLAVHGGGFFRAMEDFVDRYENVAMAGPHERGFVPDQTDRLSPVLWNSRIYSCILLDTNLPHRWRGRYNEDTDLSLRLLKDGYCTALFRALLMSKLGTAFSKGGGMKGGNTDTVYATGDHRLAFAQSLKDQHPDCVEIVWRFNRWHHQVDYSAFKRNEPILKKSITPIVQQNNYGMKLTKVK